MLKFTILPRFCLVAVFAFIVFTVIGTLSHEYGHIAVARYFGYETKLSYGSMIYFQKVFLESEAYKALEKLNDKYDANSNKDLNENAKAEYDAVYEIIRLQFPRNITHDLWIVIGGPAQTFLTSIAGLLILHFRRKKLRLKFKIVDWLAVFLTLFCLREVFNFLTALFSFVFYGKSNFNGDEFRISRYLGYNEWSIPTLTFIVSLLISFYVVFKIIPVKYRFSFIIAGLIGGISGFIIWFGYLGKVLFN